MAKYISELEVSLNKDEETYFEGKGFTKINVDLNQGKNPNPSFIWYKKGLVGITRIQLTYKDDMENGLRSANYTQIDKNLDPEMSQDPINLWYFKGKLPSDVPIMEVAVTNDPNDEASKMSSGWERMGCDLTRKTMGPRVYLWMKRETKTYISQVNVTNNFGADAELFEKGFIRMDEETNKGAGGPLVYIWYLLSKESSEAIQDLQVSLNDDEKKKYQNEVYLKVPVDLTGESKADKAYLWYKKQNYSPIQALSVIMDQNAVPIYGKYKIQVIEKVTAQTFENLCFYR